MLSVRFEDLHFRGYGDRDDYGFWIRKGGWSGWEVPPAQRADIIARATSHGTHDALQLFDAREVEQKGFFRARSLDELLHMSEQLAGKLDGTERTLVVKNGDTRRWAKFKRSLSEPTIVTSSDGTLHLGEYEIVHRMSDPRKYGETNLFRPDGTAFHYGNFPAIPTLSVTATATMTGGYTVFGPDNKRFVVTQTLPAGSTHQMDMSTGWLILNGTQQIGAVGHADLWTIPPGKTIAHGFVPTSGSGTLTGTAPDTYI